MTAELEPGSPDAMWSMGTLTLEVEKSWGDTAVSGDLAVTIPLRGAPDEELAAARELGRVVMVLADGRIARNEGLVGLVAADGGITWATLSEQEGPEFVGGIDTVDELAAAAAATREAIPIAADGTRLR